MNSNGEYEANRNERVKRGLMIWCALILFALGIWLLIEPARARGAEFHPSGHGLSPGTPKLVDNVVAIRARACITAVWSAA